MNQVTSIDRYNGTSTSAVIRYDYSGRFMDKRTITTDYAYCTVELVHDPKYDPFRRVTKITNSVGTTGTWAGRTLSDYTYTFDKAGNRLTTDASQTANYGGGTYKLQKDVNYRYDTLHRLTYADYATDTQNEQFEYDDLGNRITFTRRGGSQTAYANNKANEYTTIGGTGVTYDAAGNIDADDRNYDYDYDHDNRLTKVTFTGSGGPAEVAHYEYDALGRMISSRSRFDSDINGDTETLRYHYDGQNVIEEYDDSPTPVLQRYYVHGTSFIDERAIAYPGADVVVAASPPHGCGKSVSFNCAIDC